METADEDRITALRREVKLLLDPDEAEALAERLASLCPPREALVAAVYFDSPSRALARRAVASPWDCVKVRAKAYHPQLGSRERAVLEVKRQRGRFTSKTRVWLAPADVPAALPDLLPGGPTDLAPVVATTYRRRAFQPCPDWRVTVDRDLAFHDASWEMFAPDAPDWHAALASPRAREGRAVVELKHRRGVLPAWLAAAVRDRAAAYSKFVAAVTARERDRLAGG
jgi:hypothetical protein